MLQESLSALNHLLFYYIFRSNTITPKPKLIAPANNLNQNIYKRKKLSQNTSFFFVAACCCCCNIYVWFSAVCCGGNHNCKTLLDYITISFEMDYGFIWLFSGKWMELKVHIAKTTTTTLLFVIYIFL